MSVESEAEKKIRLHKSGYWSSEEAANRFIQRSDPSVNPEGHLKIVLDSIFIDLCRPGWKVLDLGSGHGQTSLALADHGCSVVACDISKELLRALKSTIGERAIETRVGDAFKIPATDGEFDAVVARMLVGHFANWHGIVREMVRVCRPGGTIAFHFTSREHREAAEDWKDGKPCEELMHNDPYSSAVGMYSSMASFDEMDGACSALGVKLERIIPVEFFQYNHWIAYALGTEAFRRYRSELATWLRSDEVLRFVTWFEKEIVVNLPAHFSFGSLVIISKPS